MLAIDLQEILELLEENLADFNNAPDKEAYLVDVLQKGFDEHVVPTDVPGPDWLVEPVLRTMIGPCVKALWIVLQKMAEEKAAAEEEEDA